MRAGTAPEALLLDEMFSPALADSLRQEGFDVTSVAGDPALAAGTDAHVAARAVLEGRRVVTENVRDFVPLTGAEPALRLLLSSSRRFPRSRRNPGPLVTALREWLAAAAVRSAVEWLPGP